MHISGVYFRHGFHSIKMLVIEFCSYAMTILSESKFRVSCKVATRIVEYVPETVSDLLWRRSSIKCYHNFCVFNFWGSMKLSPLMGLFYQHQMRRENSAAMAWNWWLTTWAIASLPNYVTMVYNGHFSSPSLELYKSW
jgi:hypothetical protein